MPSLLRRDSARKRDFVWEHGSVFVHAVANQGRRSFGGYDEKFSEFYAYEDVDMLFRMLNSGMRTIMPKDFVAYHIFHSRMIKFTNSIRQAGLIFDSLPKNRTIANQGVEWGNG